VGALQAAQAAATSKLRASAQKHGESTQKQLALATQALAALQGHIDSPVFRSNMAAASMELDKVGFHVWMPARFCGQ
jgi:hypothetical protein